MKERRKTEMFGAYLAIMYVRSRIPEVDTLLMTEDRKWIFICSETESMPSFSDKNIDSSVIEVMLPDVCSETFTLTSERLLMLDTFLGALAGDKVEPEKGVVATEGRHTAIARTADGKMVRIMVDASGRGFVLPEDADTPNPRSDAPASDEEEDDYSLENWK